MKKYYKGIIDAGEIGLLVKSIGFSILGLIISIISIIIMLSNGEVSENIVSFLCGIVAAYVGLYVYPRYLYYSSANEQGQVEINHLPEGKVEFICEKFVYKIDATELGDTEDLPLKDSNGRVVPLSIKDKIMQYVEMTKNTGEVRNDYNEAEEVDITDATDLLFQVADNKQKEKYFKRKYNMARATILIPIGTFILGAVIGMAGIFGGINYFVYSTSNLIRYLFVLIISLAIGFVPYIITKIIDITRLKISMKKEVEFACCYMAKKYKRNTYENEYDYSYIAGSSSSIRYIAKVGNADKTIIYKNEIAINPDVYINVKNYEECILIKFKKNDKVIKYDIVEKDLILG